jgi:4-amino-4-deoxy-L-arabinose transferase-like glycosyltransferase
VLGALTVGAVYCLALSLFGIHTAWLAAAIVAIYPEAVATSVLPLSDGPFCLWMMLQLCAWWSACKTSSASTPLAMLAGALAGLATLTRPSWLLFTPLLVFVWAVVTRGERRQLLLGVVMLVVLAITMTPWWIRNWQVTGQFVPTTLWVGPSLYDGLNPTADGSSDMSFVPRFEAQLRQADSARALSRTDPSFEYRFDRMMRDEAIDWAFTHPGRALHLAVIKLWRMWNVWPNEPQFRNWAARLVVMGTYTPIVVFAAYGMWLYRKRYCELVVLLLPAAYLSLIHAIFIGSLRYRQPAIMALAILAAAAAVEMWTSHRRTKIPNKIGDR